MNLSLDSTTRPALRSKLFAASRVLGVIACSVAAFAIVLTVLSLVFESQALQMLTALLFVPAAIVISALLALAGLTLIAIAAVKSSRRIPRDGTDAVRPRWAPTLVLNLLGGLCLPILIVVLVY